eukprot:6815012-Lingulodinium_polyedra.AAC.1
MERPQVLPAGTDPKARCDAAHAALKDAQNSLAKASRAVSQCDRELAELEQKLQAKRDRRAAAFIDYQKQHQLLSEHMEACSKAHNDYCKAQAPEGTGAAEASEDPEVAPEGYEGRARKHRRTEGEQGVEPAEVKEAWESIEASLM